MMDRLTFELSPGRYSLLIVYAASSLMAALVWNIMVRPKIRV